MGFELEPSGEIDDRVRLILGKEDVRIFEDYSVHAAILQQPAQFVTRLSAGKRLASYLLDRYPPGPFTTFQLLVGPYPQFTGEVDAVEVAGNDGSTSVSFRGRDLTARLHDCDVEAEQTFENLSQEGLLKAALKEVGLEGRPVFTDNGANLKIRTGARVKILKLPVPATEVTRVKSGGGEKIVVTAKLGEAWLTFLRRHQEKQGLFLWSTAQGGFVLSRPSKDAEPLYRFKRERGQPRNVCNVREAHFINDTTRRYSEVVIFARSGGKKFGRTHVHAGFVDSEMEGLGFKRRRVYRDANVTNAQEAAAYAARKIGEANRASWRLTYVVSGHTAPVLGGGRAVIVPDTIASVEDHELNLNENLYIESVEYRSPPRTTTITMMRPRDLVFDQYGNDD